jgi:GNAT superfamily N-acetyltransferase
MNQMIREAEHQDRERLEELYHILIPDDDEIVVLNERIDEFKQDPNHFLFVYIFEGRVEGTVLLSFCLDAMYGNRSFAVIENIIVDPAAWGTGIGKALLNHIEYCCRKRL